MIDEIYRHDNLVDFAQRSHKVVGDARIGQFAHETFVAIVRRGVCTTQSLLTGISVAKALQPDLPAGVISPDPVIAPAHRDHALMRESTLRDSIARKLLPDGLEQFIGFPVVDGPIFTHGLLHHDKSPRDPPDVPTGGQQHDIHDSDIGQNTAAFWSSRKMTLLDFQFGAAE